MESQIEERITVLEGTTVLSRREAEVQALKEAGQTHKQISEELDLSKSTVDEYSRRINDRLQRAWATARELDGHQQEECE